MNRKSLQVFKQQKVLMVGISVFALSVVVGFTFISSGPSVAPAALKPRPVHLPADNIDAQEVWMSRLEGSTKILDTKIKHLEELLLESKRNEGHKEQDGTELRVEMRRMKEELHALKSAPKPEVKLKEESLVASNHAFVLAPIVHRHLEEFVMVDEEPVASNVMEAIPAGTSVRAILVGGVDAPCGVNSPTDPQPVKLRLLDDAYLPKGVKVPLKGGILIASSYGNLSSERVYMRLERLTQVLPSGDFVETDVTGFVSGEDGKYGVRGVVVDKSSKMVASAAFSGFFSGASQFIQATVNAQNLSEATIGLPNSLKWDIVKEGCLSGTTNALDRLAEYYIDRAEQIQPVIEVASGRIVDVTFLHGVDVGDLHLKEKVVKVRDKSREVKK